MSTRSVIARQTDEGWQGIYHHSDGYPSFMGPRLIEMHNGHFGGDVEAMLHFLIDEHPGGWSFLGGDFSQAPGFNEDPPRIRSAGYERHQVRNRCFCHGDRDESLGLRTAADENWDIEWTYILCLDSLLVFEGCEEMAPVGEVFWDQEMDKKAWTRIECGESFERCSHYASAHFDNVPEDCKRMSTVQYLSLLPAEA